jgi:hypothetical protein
MADDDAWLWDKVRIGDELEPFEYLVTSKMIERYRTVVDNPTAAYPTVAGRHPLRAFNQQFGKQTLMNVGVEAEYFGAVLPDKRLKVSARIVDKYERREKPYIIVEATTVDEDGRLIEISRVVGLAAKPKKPLFSEVARKWND